MSVDVQLYIDRQAYPLKEIVQRLRATILRTLPSIREEFKMGVPWYDGKFYIVAFRDHVNLGFSVQGLSEQEKAMFEGKGKMMRHVKFYTLNDVNEDRVAEMMRIVAEKSVCSEP